ncbi:MAG: GDP-mannose 4,6-dehydratase [Nanoarchaeota archaeon]
MSSLLREFYKNKRILITGADGFIGSYLTEKLLDCGALVSIYVHSDKLKNLNSIKSKLKNIIVGDISNINTVDLITKNNPEIIFHLATESDVRNSIENPIEVNKINLDGTLNVLEATRLLKDKGLERLIFVSSYLVYGTKHNKIKESDNFEPNTPYAASKAAADLYCQSYLKTFNLPIVIIRPSNIYGYRQNKNFIRLFIDSALKDQDIRLEGGGSQTRDLIYIDDVIESLLIIGYDKKATGETFNLGSESEISIKEIAEKIINISGSKSKIISVEQRQGQDLRLCCDVSKFKRLFNWEPKINIEGGLTKIISCIKKDENII